MAAKQEIIERNTGCLREVPSKAEIPDGAGTGWYGSVFAIPGQAFAQGDEKPEVYIDPNTDAHVGAFVLGEGSLKDWQDLVAKPSRQSSCLRLSIAAALGAPFLRPLGVDSFGINWFSETSDGKTVSLTVAASVPGLLGPEGLPGWADTEAALEAQLRGCRDCPMALDDTGDGGHQMPLEEKARMLAFLIARNRPRKLSKVYERNNGLGPRETRNIVISSSERALGQIARAAGKDRLGGEEVRFMDIPASDPESAGIFDVVIVPVPGKTLRETTKDLVENIRANAIKHQGYAFRELLEKFVNDPNGLEHLRGYEEQFERDAVLPDERNAHYRIRSNFAGMYAAAAWPSTTKSSRGKSGQPSEPLKSACAWHWPRWQQGQRNQGPRCPLSIPEISVGRS